LSENKELKSVFHGDVTLKLHAISSFHPSTGRMEIRKLEKCT